jgi:hypothetical protein
MKGLVLTGTIVLALATAAAWVLTHVAPGTFGICHTVALYFGSKPSARDCEPYAAADFAVAVAIIPILAAVGLLISGEGDLEWKLPFGTKLHLTAKGTAAAQALKASDLEERADAYLGGFTRP